MTEPTMTDTTPASVLARPVVPAPTSGATSRGLGLGEAHLRGGFWGELQTTNTAATFDHCLQWMEHLGWLANFDRVASGTTSTERPGWQFSDSEVYKLLEGLAWEFGRTKDPRVDATVRALTERIAAAQDEDGYLNTCYGHAEQQPRWSDMAMGHELYCVGHLLQAAVARYRTVGDDPLVEVARRAADQVCAEFGPDGRDGLCGHPEIEVGLAELGRALGEPRYTAQAGLFLDRRGHGRLAPIPLLAPTYYQDDVPVREADVWRGHAVRALYLAAGAVDVALDTGDAEMLSAVQRQWDRTVERRTYLTGGMGSRHQDEGFGDDWELPPDRAYCETCAGIASVMVSWRLHLATGDVRYADLMERTFFNVVATSPRGDGRAFFYANPLHQREAGEDVPMDAENPRAEGGVRAPWFEVSCCPTNIARTLASWHTYLAAVDGDTVSLVQYAAADLRVALDDGAAVALAVSTDYPVSGRVTVDVTEAPGRPVTLRLRVPHWADGATVSTDGGAPRAVAPGWADVTVATGSTVVLELPVAPRLTWPDPRVDAVRGCVAVERGPLVLCLESTDLPDGVDIDRVRMDTSVAPVTAGDGAQVRAVVLPDFAQPAGRPPFGPPAPPAGGEPVDLPMVPYHRWAERGPSTMRVFLPTA
ncbi:beta-L-arabinofuranosidase domain-containing protein [Isoptericola sp. AK164]|uniref:glycoside hydrolase family 127 protein n=1 Tax=Isoptericola sp. AK164 TaxID=3024246 RepID=UPI00325BA6F2